MVKEYVACVAGEFPDTVDAPLVVDAPLSYDFKVRPPNRSRINRRASDALPPFPRRGAAS